MAFLDLQARVNASVLSRLSDGAGLLEGEAVTGVFDAAYALGNVGQLGMGGTSPVFVLSAADVPASPVGKGFVYGGQQFTVSECRPDGHGMAVLTLQEVA